MDSLLKGVIHTQMTLMGLVGLKLYKVAVLISMEELTIVGLTLTKLQQQELAITLSEIFLHLAVTDL